MDARSRRRIEMGQSALKFSQQHPETSAGYLAALAWLANRVDRAEQCASQQLAGLRDVRAAAQQKQELRHTLTNTHLAYVAQVGKVATREVPAIGQQLQYRPGSTTDLAFRTAAGNIADQANLHKDLLIKHGLSETVLDNLNQALEQFDAAVEQRQAGRRAHVGASAELRVVANEIVDVVKVLDGINRYRFSNDAELLAAWESASNVADPERSSASAIPGGPPPTGSEARPAA
jgi:hypothetical protein